MSDEFLALQRKAEAHARHLQEAADELAVWLEQKSAEVSQLASMLKSEERHESLSEPSR